MSQGAKGSHHHQVNDADGDEERLARLSEALGLYLGHEAL